MAIYETLSTKAGSMSGRLLISAMALLRRNFAKLEPKVVTSAAADYIPTLADAGQTVLRTNAGAQTVTLPQNSAVAFPIGAYVDFAVIGAGACTFQAGAGATVDKRALDTLAALTKSVVRARKVSTNGWLVSGGLTLA